VIVLRGGDTLWALATGYHTSVARLQQLNALGTSTLIYAGH
jgi:LysM repeat protein